jgi:hypothetical protein
MLIGRKNWRVSPYFIGLLAIRRDPPDATILPRFHLAQRFEVTSPATWCSRSQNSALHNHENRLSLLLIAL